MRRSILGDKFILGHVMNTFFSRNKQMRNSHGKTYLMSIVTFLEKMQTTCKATKSMIFLTPKERDLEEEPMFVESSHALHLVGIA